MKYLVPLSIALTLFTPGCMQASAVPASAKDIVYAERQGSAPALTALDIYRPQSPGPHPVVLYVHGGGWANGDKRAVGAKAEHFINAGYVFLSINYRLSPAVQHPAHVEDVATAIAWTTQHIADHGGDPKRIYLLGHSAGAHLVALVAIDQRYLAAAGVDPTCLRGVVPLDGAGYDIPTQYTWGGQRVQKKYGQAFTTDPAKQRDASPMFQISASAKIPPFLIVHAGERIASGRQAKALAEALVQAGFDAQTKHSPTDNHMTVNRGFGEKGDEVTDWVTAFLKAHP